MHGLYSYITSTMFKVGIETDRNEINFVINFNSEQTSELLEQIIDDTK